MFSSILYKYTVLLSLQSNSCVCNSELIKNIQIGTSKSRYFPLTSRHRIVKVKCVKFFTLSCISSVKVRCNCIKRLRGKKERVVERNGLIQNRISKLPKFNFDANSLQSALLFYV